MFPLRVLAREEVGCHGDPPSQQRARRPPSFIRLAEAIEAGGVAPKGRRERPVKAAARERQPGRHPPDGKRPGQEWRLRVVGGDGMVLRGDGHPTSIPHGLKIGREWPGLSPQGGCPGWDVGSGNGGSRLPRLFSGRAGRETCRCPWFPGGWRGENLQAGGACSFGACSAPPAPANSTRRKSSRHLPATPSATRPSSSRALRPACASRNYARWKSAPSGGTAAAFPPCGGAAAS